MRLLVTGASGFLGRNVLLRAPADWEIAAVYHRSLDFPAFLHEHRLAHVRPLRADLTARGEVRELAAASGALDAVLYLAANGDPTRSARDPLLDLEWNAVALLTFLEHVAVPHLVFLSSGAVYDGLVGAVSPRSPLDPTLPYAISKLASERYVRFHAETRGALASYVNVRFFGAYGPWEPPRKITTRWLTALAEGRRELTLRGDGQNLIDFMYVTDAVDGLLRLVVAEDQRVTLDLASHAPLTLDQLADAMADAMGVRVDVRHEGETAEDIRFRSVDQTMRDRFGFTTRTPLAEGLRRLHAFLTDAERRRPGASPPLMAR